MSYTLGSLFAGIGGIDLGFERAGFTTKWQVEIDPYCRKVLAKHFPHAERFEDVRNCGSANLSPVDVIAGGFPCQDISNAGKREGIDGERSGLWREMFRIIGELRPRVVFVENVAALLGRGMGRVCGDLAEIGYDAEWDIVSAADIGAPHLRERIWIMAYSAESCGIKSTAETNSSAIEGRSRHGFIGCSADVAYPGGGRLGEPFSREVEQSGRAEVICCSENMADSPSIYGGQRGSRRPTGYGQDGESEWPEALANAGCQGFSLPESEDLCGAWRREEGGATSERSEARREYASWWAIEPNVGRVAHGVPARVDRLRALGNAVVPQIPEMFAREICKALDAQRGAA